MSSIGGVFQGKISKVVVLALLVGAALSIGSLTISTGELKYNGHISQLQNNSGTICLSNQTTVCGKGNITNTQTTLNSISINSLNRTTFTGVLANQTLSEGTYTNWTRIVNENITGSSPSGVADYVIINDNGTMLMQAGSGQFFIYKNDGTQILNYTSTGTTIMGEVISESSLSGLYQIYYNQTDDSIVVYKNELPLKILYANQNGTSNGKQAFASNVGLAISPNGKYIGISGSNVDTTQELIQIWQGS